MKQLAMFERHKVRQAEMKLTGKVPIPEPIGLGDPVFIVVKAFCFDAAHGFVGRVRTSEEAKAALVGRAHKLMVEQARVIPDDIGQELVRRMRVIESLPPVLDLRELAVKAMNLRGVMGARVVESPTGADWVAVYLSDPSLEHVIHDEQDLEALEHDILPRMTARMMVGS